jgi:hypothetical protein
VSEYTEDAICRGPFEDGRQDVKRHPLIDIGPIVDGRVWIVPYNLVADSIRGII